MTVFDDKVSVTLYNEGLAFICRNVAMAETLRSIFWVCFDQARVNEDQVLSAEDRAYLKKNPPN